MSILERCPHFRGVLECLIGVPYVSIGAKLKIVVCLYLCVSVGGESEAVGEGDGGEGEGRGDCQRDLSTNGHPQRVLLGEGDTNLIKLANSQL